MRCPGEIDIARPRWAEKPAMLATLILSAIDGQKPGEGAEKFEAGQKTATEKLREWLDQLRQLPNGTRKAREAGRMAGLLRAVAGYREYPKYGMVSRYFIYKQALLKEGDKLSEAGILQHREDIFWLSFDELREAVSSQTADLGQIEDRKREYRLYARLSPPRVLTSEGECVIGSYNRRDMPEGALAGLAVSSGIVEGKARVVSDMAGAIKMGSGDILVTTGTDPSWTALLVSIKGLVTETGGLMTHGAVIAREYGLPAVVGVVDATRLIKDGDRIRVNGADGYVELLAD
jgi:pyruvate,water dikinase